MKIFISYKFTGEDKKELDKIMNIICNSLKKSGHLPYCTLWDKELQSKSKKELFKGAMKKIDESDTLLVFSKSDDKSEGMLMEIGYSMAKGKRIILLIKKDIQKTHLRELIEQIYEFESLKDLEEAVKKIK